MQEIILDNRKGHISFKLAPNIEHIIVDLPQGNRRTIQSANPGFPACLGIEYFGDNSGKLVGDLTDNVSEFFRRIRGVQVIRIAEPERDGTPQVHRMQITYDPESYRAVIVE